MTQARWKMWERLGTFAGITGKLGGRKISPMERMTWMEVRMEIVQMAVEKARGVRKQPDRG